MTNTVMTAKNTFAEGLVMDFAPDNTQATTLTSALNATLLTFNGNEMSLQNDMGNGRVETAYLPEGYVPVGTCEFGDIIYIVSYNPLLNKSQIGCFPSPERNISSEEISTIKYPLSWRDFQDGNAAPSGVIKTTSVKKILYGEKYMNPGDKYIIYTSGGGGDIQNDSRELSDFGNTSHQHNYWPKLTKIHVVAIEDSGKINYLDSDIKWYDNNYYIQNHSNNVDGSADIDSYRSLISSAYSIFQSKISGKLALLVELEQINSFSCTYDVLTTKSDNDQLTKYDIYFYIHWESNHNDVNPSGITFCKSNWIDSDKGGNVYKYSKEANGEFKLDSVGVYIQPPVLLTDYYQNNYYNPNAVIEVTRIYNLYPEDSSSITYDDYINSKSYNAQYKNYIQQTFVHPVDSALVRDSSKITQAKLKGIPQFDSNKYGKYYINLDTIESDKGYCTKLSNGSLQTINTKSIPDDVVNNYFKKDVCKYIKSFDLNTGLYDYETKTLINHDLSNLVWNYSIAPCMPYGVLDHLKINGSIDFSKIDTGKIELTQWRYYNTGLNSTISWGLDAYPEPNKGIAEVVFEFYDNQGLASAYHIQGLSSYSGQFTENITFGSMNSNYRLNGVSASGTPICHAGAVVGDYSELIEKTGKYVVIDQTTNKPYFDNKFLGTTDKYYMNDAGVLYQNQLYLVKIIVKYGVVNELDEYEEQSITEHISYRWYWTNALFNDNYYNTFDFKNLSPNLVLQNVLQIDGTGIIKNMEKYSGKSTLLYEEKDQYYNLLQTMVTYINQEAKENVKLTIIPYIESYNTFSLNKEQLTSLGFNLKVQDKEISVPETPQYNFTSHQSSNVNLINPQLDSKFEYKGLIKNMKVSADLINKLTKLTVTNNYPDIYDTEEAYLNYKDSFDLSFKDGNEINSNYYKSSQEGIDMVLKGIKFDKLITHNLVETKINNYRSMTSKDFYVNGTSSHLYLRTFWLFNHWEKGGKDGYIQSHVAQPSQSSSINSSYSEGARHSSSGRAHGDSPMMNYSEQELQDTMKIAFDFSGSDLSIIPWSIACTTYDKFNDWHINNGELNASNLFYGTPESRVKSSENNGNFVAMSLIMRNSNNSLWSPLNDWFKIGFQSGNSQLVFNGNGDLTNYTIGDLINSVLYAFVVPNYSNSSIYIPHDYTKLANYLEYWKSNLIITQNEITNSDDLIILGSSSNGCTISKYLQLVKNNSGIDITQDSLKSNVKFTIIPSKQTFNFQLGLDYNIIQLLEDFNSTIDTNQIFLNGKYYNSDVEPGGLGVINQNNVVNKKALGSIPIYNSWKKDENGILTPLSSSGQFVDNKKVRNLAQYIEYNSTNQILELNIDSITTSTAICEIDQNNSKTDDGGGIRYIDYQLLNTYKLG